jgi:hypothetical protein
LQIQQIQAQLNAGTGMMQPQQQFGGGMYQPMQVSTLRQMHEFS